jgi:hypothetical protein
MRPLRTLLIIEVAGWVLGSGTARADTPGAVNLEPLLDAIVAVESHCGLHTVGDGGRAMGPYQIHRGYWRDGTKLLGVDWPYEDAGDAAKARQVVRAYLLYYGKGKSLIDLARIHNGGPDGDRQASTRHYASKIRKALDARTSTR